MIALTGGTGFLGSHLAEYLQKEKIPFRSLVRAGSPRLEESRKYLSEVREVNFDDPASIASALEGCDVVIHALGLINGSEEQLERVNVVYSQNMVTSAKEKKISKFICVSSVAALMKHGPYGESKARGEQKVIDSGLPYIVLRPAWIFGNRDTNVTAKITRTLKNFPIVPLLGGGTFKIQPVYVDDLVKLIHQTIDFSSVNTCYTVAGGEQVTLKVILETFARHMKLKRCFLPVPLKPVQALCKIYLGIFPNTKLPVKQILELDKHDAFDISKTRRDFGFNPRSFQDGASAMFGAR